MPSKRVLFLCYGSDDICKETYKFIEETGALINFRDIGKNPLSEHELESLIGNLEIGHFLNTLSESYTKNGLDKERPSRRELFQMMAKDYTLIRRPIVKASRLITIGFDRAKMSEMLQMSSNSVPMEFPVHEQRRNPKRRNKRQPASTGK